MRNKWAWAAVLWALAATAASAQMSPKVEEIRTFPNRFLNEVVAIEGVVTQYVEEPAQTTRFFYLKDDWGGLIKVRTTQEAPQTNKRYRVTGPVGIENRIPYISEETRIFLEPPPVVVPQAAPGPASPQPGLAPPMVDPVVEPPPPAGPNWVVIGLIAGIVVVGLVLVVLLVIFLRPKETPSLAEAAGPMAMPAGPAGVVEGKTIKLQTPPAGTLKLLPGRFEVTRGDDQVKEVRFYMPKNSSRAEITFGRAAGPAYSHIQLKPMTVSSRQAKILWDGAAMTLVNYASAESNPTTVNGRSLNVEESVVLKDKDLITMGEIEFRYQAS
jgi:hypothetical protein